MNQERERLLQEHFDRHKRLLSRRILIIAFIYLTASMTWNLLFSWLELPYSRATTSYLGFTLAILIGIGIWHKQKPITGNALRHVTLGFVMLVEFALYFGSGYSEAWAFFLLIPLLTGLYAERGIMLTYITLGLGSMLWLSVQFPLTTVAVDAIDLSNRVLLYIIVATVSFLIVEQMIKLLHNQVNTIIESADHTIEQVAKSFILSIEAKDAYTFGHSERVSRYAVELAQLMPDFYAAPQLKSLRLAGLLHDIGKINIPELVLTKPSGLSDEEFELIKTHPVVGARMVDKIDSLRELKPAILHHHERWDGRGYPSGLQADTIPMEARIMAVADAFDAMTSSRAYRNALGFHEAIRHLTDGKGTQFDPRLIELLEAVQIPWRKIYNEYNSGLDEFEQLTNLL